MNCEESKNLITVCVYGKLTPSEKGRLEIHLRECPSCASRYEKAVKMSHLINDQQDIPLPDKEKSWQIISAKALKKRDRWLERLVPKRPAFQLSYALLLLVVGFAVGYFINSGWQRNAEIAQLHQEVLQIREITAASLVRQESLNYRLRELGLDSFSPQPEEGLLRSFLRTVAGEADVEARPAREVDLYRFLRDPRVREDFIQSLSDQTSPLVEIALTFARHIEKSKL